MPILLAETMKDYKVLCFTRFLINLPTSTSIAYGRLTAGGEISRIPNTAFEIDNIISSEINKNRKNAEIFTRGTEFDKMAGRPLISTNPKIRHLLTIIGSDEYNVRTYFKIENDTYIISTLGVMPDSIYSVMTENVDSAQHLFPRNEAEIPTQPGICIDGAFSTHETPYEGIELGVRLSEFPDVHFSIQTIKNGNGLMSVDLKDALKNARQNAEARGLGFWVSGLKILRIGKRIVNDWQGEEMLLHVPGGFGKPSHHKFLFRTSGKKHDPLYPFVEMTLDTGVEGNQSASKEPSLTDEEALALWDWLLNSIRVRPNAVAAKASAPAKPGA